MLLSGGVVSEPIVRSQLWAVLRRRQSDFDVAIATIPRTICGRVTKHVLIPELVSDSIANRRQVVEVIDREVLAACLFRQFGEQARAIQFLAAQLLGSFLVEDSQGIYLHVAFEHRFLDFALRETAAIVPPVGKDNESLAQVAGFLHL